MREKKVKKKSGEMEAHRDLWVGNGPRSSLVASNFIKKVALLNKKIALRDLTKKK